MEYQKEHKHINNNFDDNIRAEQKKNYGNVF